ncbi:hypothetical protein J1605_002988 [Eschrichtius robustus]|uniref:Uncharacterized protein n=1 Tax=Eschrichtius robustus TaxID=9764 RepID=A0AB34HTF0_ESCRO|nr:hypothetical protein J1605_002988 [Eschrichtius robustus]
MSCFTITCSPKFLWIARISIKETKNYWLETKDTKKEEMGKDGAKEGGLIYIKKEEAAKKYTNENGLQSHESYHKIKINCSEFSSEAKLDR